MLRLRPYHRSDAERILSWITDERAFYKWTAGALGDYPLSAEQFQFVENHMAFTAIDDEDVVGFLIMRRPTESFDDLRFGFIIVDARKRGSGYGKNMLRLAIRYAKEIYGAKRISLGVFENNPSAYGCYKAVGFRDAAAEQTTTYRFLGEEWNCLGLEMQF